MSNWELTQECKVDLTSKNYINVLHHINKIKDQKCTIGSIEVEVFQKNPTQFYDKNPQKTSNRREFLQSEK